VGPLHARKNLEIWADNKDVVLLGSVQNSTSSLYHRASSWAPDSSGYVQSLRPSPDVHAPTPLGTRGALPHNVARRQTFDQTADYLVSEQPPTTSNTPRSIIRSCLSQVNGNLRRSSLSSGINRLTARAVSNGNCARDNG